MGGGDDGGPDGLVMQPAADDRVLMDFVYHEARLIDEKRFDEWYALYAD